MTKLEFLKELESLLPDIPLEEREEALRYYNGYFEDAGEEQEEEIIKEIGSPSKVAAIIKADLNSNAIDRENRGYFTENGYQDTVYTEDKFELVGTKPASSNEKQEKATASFENPADNKDSNTNRSGENSGNPYTNSHSNQGNNSYSYSNSNSGGNDNNNGNSSNTTKQQTKNNSNNTALFLIIGIFTFPIWFPFLMSALGIAIGVIAAILGIIFGFGVAGVTMMGVGIALFFAGLIQISVPFIGVLMVGAGLFVLGLGMLFTIVCILLCRNVLPALIKGLVNLCRLPFKNRRVMA